MAASSEYVIDCGRLNEILGTYQLNAQMLPGQVFDIIEKKLIKGIMDEIDKAKPQAVRFVNVEAIPSGPERDFTYAICGGLSELIDSLAQKKIAVTGTITDPRSLPWSLISRIDKNFKGFATLHEATAKS
jgi:hypothetical protein